MRHCSFLSVIAAAVLLLMLPLAGCNDSGEPTIPQVLEKAQMANAASEIASYRFTINIVHSAEGIAETSSSVIQGYSLLPDRHRYITRSAFEDGQSEIITIGRVMYIRENGDSQWREIELPNGNQEENILELSRHLDVFINSPVEAITESPSESIDDVECWRYKLEHTSTLDRLVRQMEEASDSETRAMFKSLIEGTQATELTETRVIWVGKTDYLVRRVRDVQVRTSDGKHEFGFPNVIVPEGVKYTFAVTMSFSGFNEPVEIQAPTMSPTP